MIGRGRETEKHAECPWRKTRCNQPFKSINDGSVSGRRKSLNWAASVGADFEQGYRQVQDRIGGTDQDRLEKLNEMSQSLGGVFERMFQSTEAFDRSEQQLLARYDGL